MLPSGRRIECQPKVPIGTLFTMLAVVYELDVPLDHERAPMAFIQNLLAFIVRHFLALVDDRRRAGFVRDYIEVEDNLPAVRGRIVIAEDARRNVILRHRTFCRFTEYTHDIPENQLIRQVVHLLAGWPLPATLVRRLRQTDAAMSDVTPTRFTGAVVERFRYDRVRTGYRELHRWCRLFLDGLSLEQAVGGLDFRTFLIDMNRLFERFVALSVARRLPAGIRLGQQYPVALAADGRVPMSVDLVLTRDGAPFLVADTKYKRLDHGQQPADVYQMLAYCVATGVPVAALIYPRTEVGAASELRPLIIRNAGVTVRSLTVDLGLTGDALIREMRRLADHVVAIATPSPVIALP